MRAYISWLTTAILVLLLGSPAFAVVTTWDYNISSLFTNTQFTDNNSSDVSVTYTTLSWGDPATNAGQSSLVINPATVTAPPSPRVNTYIGSGIPTPSYWGTSISVTHNNNPIYAPSLVSTTIRTSVTLDPYIPDNGALPIQNFDFDIKFAETPNQGNYQNDVFALVGGFPNLNFNYDDGSGLSTYFVNIFPSDGNVLSVLSDEYADLAGVDHGTIGFTTVEGYSTTLPFAFTISTRPLSAVPEPSTLLLLGGGLAGLAFCRRKRS